MLYLCVDWRMDRYAEQFLIPVLRHAPVETFVPGGAGGGSDASIVQHLLLPFMNTWASLACSIAAASAKRPPPSASDAVVQQYQRSHRARWTQFFAPLLCPLGPAGQPLPTGEQGAP